MEKIDFSFDSITKEFLRLRNCKLKSNFFMNKEKFDFLFINNAIQFISKPSGCYLIVNDNGFKKLYFATESVENFERDLQNCLKSDVIITSEIVAKQSFLADIKEELSKVGFYQYTSLVRMSKPKTSKDLVKSSELHQLNLDKKKELNNLFKVYFDKFAEQIPTSEELETLIKNNSVYYFSDNTEIQGFIIFEVNGYSSHLRYWFVHPDHRNKNIGSQLMQLFFNSDKGVKRELFWVIESNENAIKRYKHYGFEEENLHNLILINRKLKYEK